MDAGDLQPGAMFRCLCGAEVTVPKVRAHSASVVRCSSCGASRSEEANFCGFCGSDFTLHEQDLHTVCPECFARISDRAKFCHHCATEIMPQGRAGERTTKKCPACGDKATLASRSLKGLPAAILECDRCAGFWLEHRLVKAAVNRARDRALPLDLLPTTVVSREFGVAPRMAPQQGSFYRPCPECGRQMLRKNYGQRSGVIVDVCAAHGIWFDADELNTVLTWVRNGGLEEAKRRAEERERGTRPTGASLPPLPPIPTRPTATRGGTFGDGAGGFLGEALAVLAWIGLDSL
jgi:Zn-finger nucleic acid-binding protein/ribosomal protein L40E